MAATNVQAFSGDVTIPGDVTVTGETILGTATYRKRRDWNRTGKAYVYLGNVRTSNTTGIRLDVSLNNSNSGYIMNSFQITLFAADSDHSGGQLVYSVVGLHNASTLSSIDIGYVYVSDGTGLYTYQLWLKDPVAAPGGNPDLTGTMDAYLNCQGYYIFDTGVSDVAHGGSAPTNFNVGVPGVVCDYTGKVGIGTNAPESLLHLSARTASADITDPIKIKIHNTRGAGDWSITQPWGLLEFDTDDTGTAGTGPVAGIGCRFEQAGGGDSSICFYTDNVVNNDNVLGSANERMCINSDGKVGVGTASPLANLDVNGNIKSRGNLYLAPATLETNTKVGANDTFLIMNHTTYSSTVGPNYPLPECGTIMTNRSGTGTFPWLMYTGIVKDVATTNAGESLRMDWGGGSSTGSATDLVDATLNPLMTLRRNGNLGIGTVNPVQKLHLYDTTTEPTIAIQHLSANENNSSTNILGNLCLHRSHRSGVGNQVGIRSIRRADTWDDQADMEFYVRNGGYGEQTAMVINSGGTSATSAKVGIGTNDPKTAVDINGNVRIGGTLSQGHPGYNFVYSMKKNSASSTGDLAFTFSMRLYCNWTPIIIKINVSSTDGNSGEPYAWSYNVGYRGADCGSNNPMNTGGILFSTAMDGADPGSAFLSIALGGNNVLTVTIKRNGRDNILAEVEAISFGGIYL
jgi:hypothetical protein